MKTNSLSLILVSLLASFAFLPAAQAVVPPPDGGYPNFTTAEGTNALFSLTGGTGNTGVGWHSLFSDTIGSFNTGVGAGTLALNNGESNTAIGTAALLLNTIGGNNTAVGTAALLINGGGNSNTAVGVETLNSNTTGNFNTATGQNALANNNADLNTANGAFALQANTTGTENTAVGESALVLNIDGDENTALGRDTLLQNISGDRNTAVGLGALLSNTADDNTAVGILAGSSLTTGDGNVCIGTDVAGEAGSSNTTWIRNVNTLGQPIVAGIDGVTVRLSDGRLGHGVSSRRYKQDIKPMDRASEALYALKPVTFHYKKEIDSSQTLDFGLVAEEVAEVNPELAVRDREGKISNYRRDAINAMLLNEFLKEHKTVQEQGAIMAQIESRAAKQEAVIAQQQKQIEALTAGLQKMSAQLATASPPLADLK